MLISTLAIVLTSWKNHHTQWVLRQMTQNFLNSLMAIWKTLMHHHLKCMHQHLAVSKKRVSFCLVSRVPEATFLLAMVFLTAWLSHPLIGKLAKSRGKGKKKGKLSSHEDGKFPNLGTFGVLPKPSTSRSESRPPLSKQRPSEAGATRGGPSHALRLCLDQCMQCRHVGHRATEMSQHRKTTAFSTGRRAYDTYALGCAVFDAMCYGAAVEETEQDKDENGIEDFVAFSIKSLEGFAILAHRLHRLDVVREYGLVIDHHYNRVYIHVLERYFLCASLPTGHLALEMMLSNSE